MTDESPVPFYQQIRSCDAFMHYIAQKLHMNPNVPNGELVEALAIIWSKTKHD